MTKRGKTLALRRQRAGVEDALLIRSAESLGRMIGSLQRQLAGASKTLSGTTAMKMFGLDGDRDHGGVHRGAGHSADGASAGSGARKTGRKTSRTAARAAPTKDGSRSGVTKVRSTADRKSKRASKSAGAKKAAGSSRSGAGRKASKGSRRR